MSTRDQFDLLRTTSPADPGALDALWAELPTLTPEEMLGAWRGGDFATGHPAGALLGTLRWHGKRFDSLLEGHPLVCHDEDGELYSNTKAAGGGYSSLWAVGFRGEVTATMVYDALPVLDHFKQVDEATVMGIMNGKLETVFGTPDPYYFWLERDEA